MVSTDYGRVNDKYVFVLLKIQISNYNQSSFLNFFIREKASQFLN